ncbi:MAG: response regulator [Chloroflexi bacterium]|nr:response regulator [Chloroflexota bacterium]
MSDSLRVLIVDDNDDHVRLATEFLQAAGAFTVEAAINLRDLWDHLAAAAYDVVLLDYSLPDGNGLEALAEIPARGYRVPVVMVTGRGDERVAAQAIQRGAVDYLVKIGGYLNMLPALVHKAVRQHQLMLSAQRSLEQIRYQALLLDNVRDAVVVWDLAGRITFWNRAAEMLSGKTAEERLGRSVSAYCAAFDPPVEAAAQAARGDVERQVCGNSKEAIWISSRVTPLYDGDGRRLGYMDVCRDITARKTLEAQIRAAQTHLAQAVRLTAIGELASGVAHQINNPLTTMIGEAQILLSQLPPDHPARESAEAIERAGWRAQAVVQRLLEFSQPAPGTLESLSIDDTVKRALALIERYVVSAKVTVETELAGDLPPVRGNARQLEDLWVNLLLFERNALANGQPHRIRLRSERGPGGEVMVCLSAGGLTLPPDRLASIFEPDFIGPVTGHGQGLAMSICREVVRQHQGRISVESDPASGTVFKVTFPAEA